MVLDESALEAMIARQRASEREHEPQETVRTEQNDEFEVYERPESDEPEPAAKPRQAPVEGNDEFEVFERPAAPEPEPAEPAPAPVQVEEEFEVFERMPEPEAAPEPLVAPEPTPEPEPVPEPVQESVVEPESVAEPTPERRRPKVWPPIGNASRKPADVPRPSIPVAPEPEPVAEAPAPKPRTHNPTAHNFAEIAVDGSGRRIAIVQALFNQELTDQMVDSARKRIEETGAEVAQVLTVPGVYDLPLPVQTLARSKRIDAVVVIGCVVQGSTKHDELITFSTAKTLQEISLATETPIGLGIIGPGMTWEQAEARVGNGAHAVDAVLALLQH